MAEEEEEGEGGEVLAVYPISALPGSAYYIPNFITTAEEATLLQKARLGHSINTAPLPTWRHLSHRRLQTYPSPLTPTNTLLASPLPDWLQDPIILRLHNLKLSHDSKPTHPFQESPHTEPNHVLVNEYAPGQGILPHEDGNAYHPVVATVSLGSHIVLDIYAKKADGSGEREESPRWRILQEPRSLLVTQGELYRGYLHGIAEVRVDEGLDAGGVVNWEALGDQELFGEARRERGTRVSLTFRDVVKVKRLGKGLGFLGRR